MILSAQTFMWPIKFLFILVAFDAAFRRSAYLPLFYGLGHAIFQSWWDLIRCHYTFTATPEASCQLLCADPPFQLNIKFAPHIHGLLTLGEYGFLKRSCLIGKFTLHVVCRQTGRLRNKVVIILMRLFGNALGILCDYRQLILLKEHCVRSRLYL